MVGHKRLKAGYRTIRTELAYCKNFQKKKKKEYNTKRSSKLKSVAMLYSKSFVLLILPTPIQAPLPTSLPLIASPALLASQLLVVRQLLLAALVLLLVLLLPFLLLLIRISRMVSAFYLQRRAREELGDSAVYDVGAYP